MANLLPAVRPNHAKQSQNLVSSYISDLHGMQGAGVQISLAPLILIKGNDNN